MKKFLSISTTVGIVIILTLTLSLLPAQQVEVIRPDTTSEFVYNSFTKHLRIESNFIVPVTMNISKINQQTDSLSPQITNLSFQNSITIEFNSSGLYYFEIRSPELIRLTFTDLGIKNSLIVSLIGLFIVKVALWVYESNFFTVDLSIIK